MAGTTLTQYSKGSPGERKLLKAEQNRVIDDLEKLRATIKRRYRHDPGNLAAGADISGGVADVAIDAETVVAARLLHKTGSAGVDASSNTVVVSLQNNTTGQTIGTATITANSTAGTVTTLTLNPSFVAVNANAIYGITITQNGVADLNVVELQWEAVPQTIDAAADLLAAKVNP
jgi:hypothetical protein